MYVDVKEGTRQQIIDYIEMYLTKADYTITPDEIGKCLIIRMRTVDKAFLPGMSCVVEGSRNERIWGVFKLCWYNRELFHENEYKTLLQPIGKYWQMMPERAWYNESIESEVLNADAFIVDDPIEAFEIAEKLNEYKIGLEEQ